MSHRLTPAGLSALSLFLAVGLAAQQAPAPRKEGAYQNPYAVNYKRFTRGDNGKVQDEAERRLEWWRARMGGDLSPEFMAHYAQEAEVERRRFPALFPTPGVDRPAAVSGTTWTNIGPTSSAFTQNGIQLNKVDSGRPRTILPDPADANTVYLLTAGGGLWKTTNFLSTPPTWTAMTDSLGSTSGGAAAFGRSSSVLYVGTGDPFDVGVGGFVAKSTNGASSWGSNVALTGATKVYDLKVDTSVGSTTATDIVLAGTNKGLFRSTDGGATYTSNATLANLRIWSIVNTSAGWLCSAHNNSASTVGGLASQAGALFISTDHGATWNPITNSGNGFSGAGRTTLGVGAAGDAIVYAYAAIPNGTDQKDLFRSADGGQTWTPLSLATKTPANNVGDQADMDLMNDQAWYNQMLLVDPSDAARNTVLIGGNLASARTTDGGATWRILSDWLAQGGLQYIHADFHASAAVTISGTTRFFVGTDGGLFTSSDKGDTWDDSKNVGLATHLIYALTANPATAGSAWIGLQDNGTRMRSGSTATFNQLKGGDGFGVGWSQANQAAVLSTYVYNKISRSTANPPTDQTNFSTFTSGLGSTGATDNGASYYFVTPITTPSGAADPSGNVFFTYGNDGTGTNSGKIFKSNASGWTAIGTPGSAGLSTGRFVRSVSHGIGVHPTDLNRIAAAGNGGNLLVTTDGGTTWNEYLISSLGLATWPGYNANVAWVSNDVLYVASENSGTGAPHVAKTTNLSSGSPTFTQADNGLPDLPVTKLAVDPGDATGNTLYAATWLGVYRTTNGGANWSRFGTGLPQGRATDIYVAPDSSFIRVATWGRGVWEVAGAPAVSLTITEPGPLTVSPSGTTTLHATVSNATNTNVTWSTVPAATGSFSPTTTASGAATTWTAPATAQVVTLKATAVQDGTTAATVLANVYNPATLTVSIAPAPAYLTNGDTLQFTPTVNNAPSPTVTWSASGVGSVNTSGLYTAPASGTGTATVTATSIYTAPGNAGSATVTIKTLDLNGDAAVDFKDMAFLAAAVGTATPAAKLTSASANVDDTDISKFLAKF
ncbi:MAG TPA: hypothetical protein VJ623_12660 [Holophagaceae bacterium]|nr:hypothetical protein [Holophagaceae bacterium]